MKNTIKIIILILGLGVLIPAKAEKTQVLEINKKPNWQTDTFAVSNMSCQLDMALVENALFRVKGVKTVLIKGEQVIVKYNVAKLDAKKIISTIENTGTCEDPNEKLHKVSKQ